MTLEEILKQIESQELKEAVVDIVNAEKERGISSYKKKDYEVVKLKNALKDLGYDKDKYEDVNEFIETKKKVASTVDKSKLTIASLNDRLDDLTSKLEAEKAAVETQRAKAANKAIMAELVTEAGNKFYGSEYLFRSLISDNKVGYDADNDTVFFKNGEDVVPFDKGIAALMEENKGMLKADQVPGTGNAGGKGVSKIDDELMAKSDNEILDELGL